MQNEHRPPYLPPIPQPCTAAPLKTNSGLGALHMAIVVITSEAMEAKARLKGVGDRALGAVPDDESCPRVCDSPYDGALGDADRALAILHAAVDDIHMQITRLEAVA